MKYLAYMAITLIISTTALMIKFGWRDVINIIGPAITTWTIVAVGAAVLTGFSVEQFKWRWPWKK